MEQYLASRGMKINSSKSRCLSVQVANKVLVSRSRPFITAAGLPIPMVTSISPMRYLGHQYGLNGIAKPTLAKLPNWLKNIHNAPLKPDQKQSLVKDHIIQRMLFAYPCGNQRRWARNYGALFRHPRDFAQDLWPLRERQRPHWTALREKIKSGFLTSGLEACSDAVASRGWIYNKPQGWSGRDYIKAIQLRTANLPTQGIASNPPEQQQCRAGCPERETICRMLTNCSS